MSFLVVVGIVAVAAIGVALLVVRFRAPLAKFETEVDARASQVRAAVATAQAQAETVVETVVSKLEGK